MKATLVVVAILFSAGAEGWGEFRCPKFWTEFEGHCYRYFNQPRLDFAASQRYCQNLRFDTDDTCGCRRSNLVTIESYAENTFILEWWRSIREPTSDRQHVRIGYTDEGSERNWRWVSGSNSRYTSWDHGQPDNSGGRQHCAVMWKTGSDNGKWDDEGCGASRAFICEY